jgi:hypothetical protein
MFTFTGWKAREAPYDSPEVEKMMIVAPVKQEAMGRMGCYAMVTFSMFFYVSSMGIMDETMYLRVYAFLLSDIVFGKGRRVYVLSAV